MKIFLYILLFTMILILFVLGLYLIIGYSSYKFSLTKRGGMVKKIQKKYNTHLEKIGVDKNYFNCFKKIEINSEDNLKLCGFYKDNNSSKLVLLTHGYARDHFELTNIAKIFEKRGYDILAIDMRSHGQSEGANITMGKEESKDLVLWINQMIELKSHYKIVLFGMSMGATTVCLTCGEKIPSNVVLAIEDCGFDNAEKQFSYVFSKRKSMPKIIFKLFFNYTKKTVGLNLKEIDASLKLRNSKIPIMFIHGDKDKFVPIEMMYNMSSQIPATRKRVYVAKEAEHTLASCVDMKKYEKEINNFLNEFYM